MAPSQSPDGVSWSEVYGGFSGDDRTFYCSTTGQPARPGEPVYRGSMIDLEGFYTICRDSAIQLAELVGYVDPSESDVLSAALETAHEELVRLRAENESLHELIEHLRSYNATFVTPEDDGWDQVVGLIEEGGEE